MSRQQRRLNERLQQVLVKELSRRVDQYFKFIAAHPNEIDAQAFEMKRMDSKWRQWCLRHQKTHNVPIILPMFITEVNRVLTAGSGIEES